MKLLHEIQPDWYIIVSNCLKIDAFHLWMLNLIGSTVVETVSGGMIVTGLITHTTAKCSEQY